MAKRRNWSDDDLKYILSKANKVDPQELVKHFNTTPIALYNIARLRLGIVIDGLLDQSGKLWTNEQKELLKKHYGNMPSKELEKLLDKSALAIRIKASRMKLTK